MELSRTVDPPVAVWLHSRTVWPPRLAFGRDTPLVVRAHGVDQRDPIPAVLHLWALTCTGQWLGLVECTVRVDGCDVQLRMLVAADALTPR